MSSYPSPEERLAAIEATLDSIVERMRVSGMVLSGQVAIRVQSPAEGGEATTQPYPPADSPTPSVGPTMPSLRLSDVVALDPPQLTFELTSGRIQIRVKQPVDEWRAFTDSGQRSEEARDTPTGRPWEHKVSIPERSTRFQLRVGEQWTDWMDVPEEIQARVGT